MLRIITILAAVASFAMAQQTSFKPGTGVRSLWIPFQTVSGTPLASIATHDSSVTVYVLSCPTASPSCALSPNLTLTEGPSTVKYTIKNTAGTAVLDCEIDGTSSAACTQAVAGGGDISKTSSTLTAASQILYQAVEVTATQDNTSTMPKTVTVTATSSTSTSTSSTSSSTAGAQTAGAQWAMGGAVGAGLFALAAL